MKWWALANAIGPAAVTDMMITGCLSHQFMCSPCLPEKEPAPSSMALVTMGAGLALVVWSEKEVYFFALLWIASKAANRYPQTGLARDLHILLFFFLFPDLNFHHLCTSFSTPLST